MSDFEPTTDFPESVDNEDAPVRSEAAIRDERVQLRRRTALRVLAIVVLAGLLVSGQPIINSLIAVAAGYLMLAVGIRIIGAFARPIPEAPPAGELRRVKLTYRCPTCGAELRMTLANDQVPAPPRHCQDEMELTTNLDDLL